MKLTITLESSLIGNLKPDHLLTGRQAESSVQQRGEGENTRFRIRVKIILIL